MAAYGAFERHSVTAHSVPGRAARASSARSPVPTSSRRLPTPRACRVTFGGSDRYAYIAGTSMAAPQVTAAAR